MDQAYHVTSTLMITTTRLVWASSEADAIRNRESGCVVRETKTTNPEAWIVEPATSPRGARLPADGE